QELLHARVEHELHGRVEAAGILAGLKAERFAEAVELDSDKGLAPCDRAIEEQVGDQLDGLLAAEALGAFACGPAAAPGERNGELARVRVHGHDAPALLDRDR